MTEPRRRSTRRAARLVIDACARDRHIEPRDGVPMVCQRCTDLAWQILLIVENDALFADYLPTSPSRSEALS